MQIETYADINNNLNKWKNPFIEASNNLSNSSDSNITMIKKEEKKLEANMGQKSQFIFIA